MFKTGFVQHIAFHQFGLDGEFLSGADGIPHEGFNGNTAQH
jgi:hypothetical protein